VIYPKHICWVNWKKYRNRNACHACTLKKAPPLGEEKFSWIIEISVKSGKDSTSTLSLVIHRVRFLKNLQKCRLVFNRG